MFAALCRGAFASLVDARWYLPEDWTNDPERCERAAIYCLSNAPRTTSLQELARVQAQRYFIEHAFREAKSERGLADYQVRRWDAWRHHLSLVMLAALFLVKQKIHGRRQWPMLSFNDLVTALAHLPPRRQLTAEELAAIIEQRHRLRRKAKDSHARHTQVALE